MLPNEWIIKDSSWFYVNYVKAGEKMKSVFNHYGSYLEKAEKLRVENVSEYSEAAMDKAFHGFLDQYVPKFAIAQKIVIPQLKKISLPSPKQAV